MLTYSGWQWAGVIAATRLPEISLRLPASYLLMRSALYGLLSLGIAFGLFFGRTWAPGSARWISLGMLGWTLIERLVFAGNSYAIKSLAVTTVVYLLLWGVLLFALKRPSAREYFQEHPV